MYEIAGIIILGIFAQWLAWRLKVPAILPLILVGLIVGPISTFYTEDGSKWIEPLWKGDHGLFPGNTLFYFVELAIGIILFEGGLTLKREEIKDVGPTIGKLISVGALLTFVLSTVFAHFIVGLSWPISSLFGALVIVTGPTVIAPILRNLALKTKVSTVLKWEGILIDPIGALAAVLVFEFISSSESGGHFTEEAFKQFITILGVGASLGTFSAFALREIIKQRWVPHYLLNVFTLAVVMFVFVGSSFIVPESGLLTIVVMGVVLGNINTPHIEDILYFKESLSLLLISILFILLSANINISDLELINNPPCIALFFLIILVVRPAGVFLSTRHSNLNLKEKLFVSWVGPRGIVAAGIASLFGTKLVLLGMPGAEYITPLVFMVVLGTVILNATTAGIVAKLLDVLVDKSNGILIIGANQASRLLGGYLKEQGRKVVILDSNKNNIVKAKNRGLIAHQANIYNDDLSDNIELNDIGYLLAMTGSDDVNKFALEKYEDVFGEEGAYRFVAEDEMSNNDLAAENALFSRNDDYINFSEVARDYPQFHEVPIVSSEDLLEKYNALNRKLVSIPLFVKNLDGSFIILDIHFTKLKIEEGARLVYMGKELDFEPPKNDVIPELA